MPAAYVQCLVCGRLTPVDKGRCYHCRSPLPSSVRLPKGYVVCPNCLRLTPVDTGLCTHCRSRLPPDLVAVAKRELEEHSRSVVVEGQEADSNTGSAGSPSPARRFVLGTPRAASKRPVIIRVRRGGLRGVV